MNREKTPSFTEIRVSRSSANGALKTGFLPGATGWYWAQRNGYVAPEVVHVVAPEPRVSPNGTVRALTGEFPLIGSEYGAPDTRWFGPFQAPVGWDRFSDQ